jgi:outer membrane usher protein
MLKYKTVTGRAALIRAPLPGDTPLPFGADVVDKDGRSVGVVAQDSRIFVRGVEDSGTLFVKTGESGQQCSIRYALPARAAKADAADVYNAVESHCMPVVSSSSAPDR